MKRVVALLSSALFVLTLSSCFFTVGNFPFHYSSEEASPSLPLPSATFSEASSSLLPSSDGVSSAEVPTYGGFYKDVLNVRVDKDASLPLSDYYYRSCLSDVEKEIYDDILNAALNYETEIRLSVNIKFEHLKRIVAFFYLDHPEVFWWSKKYTYYRNPTTQNVTKLEMTLLYGEVKIDAMRSNVEWELQKILDLVPENATDFDAELIFHDYLSQNVTYGNEGSTSGDDYFYSIYGALVKKNCVCEGYAEAFQYLCQRVGIPSVGITGTAVNGTDTESHKWNGVKIGGKWYLVDVTWDDIDKSDINRSAIFYTYFNSSSEDMPTHSPEEDLVAVLPSFDSHEASFHRYLGLLCEDSDPTEEFFRAMKFFGERLDYGDFTLELKAVDNSIAEDCFDYIHKNIYQLIDRCNAEAGRWQYVYAQAYYPVNKCSFRFVIQRK